jgi:hypothetical protein
MISNFRWGRSIKERKEEYMIANEIHYTEVTSEAEALEPVYSPEESEEIRERLKGMGYMG